MFDQTTQGTTMGQVNGGYQYNGYMGGAQPVQKVMNNLTAEEIQELQKQKEQFNLGLTHKESLQAACNHRTPDGTQDSLVYDNETGVARCTICGYEFKPIDPDTSLDSITASADELVDILQTIKIMYQDLPAQAAREFFQIIPLIKKIPELFTYASKNFNKHEANLWNYQNRNMGAMAMLGNLNAMLGQGMNQGFQQQPAYNPYVQQQPMQPAFNQAAGYPNAAYAQPNPFGYQGASMMNPGANPVFQQQPQGYVPQSSGFAYTPNTNAPVAPATPSVTTPAAPAAPAAAVNPTKAPETTTVQQTVKV